MVPRLRYEDLEPELRALLAEKYSRLGYLGEFFQVTAHQPAALADFIRFTNTVGAALPVALGEIAALVVSTALGSDYERHQHERLALSLGFAADWIRAAEYGAMPNALDRREQAVRRLALAIARTGGRGAGEALADAEAVLGPETVVAAVLAVARFVAHATVVQTFQLTPPVSSPLDTAKPAPSRSTI